MQKHALQDLIEPVVSALGYETVRVMTTGQVNPTLQVMIDVADFSREIDVEDCAKVSRALSKMLDEKDPIESKYRLEVSSPGLDRPLTKPAHFDRFKGNVVKVDLNTEVDKRKRLKGELCGIDAQNNVCILCDDKKFVTPFDNISKAKILLTDELLEQYQAEHPDSEF